MAVILVIRSYALIPTAVVMALFCGEFAAPGRTAQGGAQSGAGQNPESAPRAKPVPAHEQGLQSDIAYWQSVKDATDPEPLQLYIDKFPDGTFVDLARIRLAAAKDRKARSAGPALIYVFREKEDVGNLSLFVDGKRVARISSGRYVKLQVPAGRHRLIADDANQPGLILDTTGGETHYVAMKLPVFKKGRLEVQDPSAGKPMIETLRPIDDKWIFDKDAIAK